MGKTLIVDMNSIGHAANYATKLTSGALQTQAIFGSLKTIRQLRLTYPDFTIMGLWDGRAQWRFDLHPEYKSNRESDPKAAALKKAYVEQRPYIARGLSALGVRQMTVATHEADDMAGYLVESLMKRPGSQIVLITGDGDWKQLIRPGVTWRDLRDDTRTVTAKTFFDKTGFKTPYAFLEGKCLQGDGSDVIPGVGGIGEKGAPEFIAEFGSVRRFWQLCDSGEFVPKYVRHQKLASPEGRAIFRKNFRLMQLLRVEKPDPANVRLDKGQFSKERLAELCEELAFGTILKTLDTFVQPFNLHN